jgi:hypothetical protein
LLAALATAILSGVLLFVKARYLPRIQRGEKTATIRPWRTCSLQPGARLSFNGKLRARLVRVTLCTLNTVSDAHIAADGFPSRAAFRRAYRSHYPTAARNAPCCVLEFALARS